MQEQNSLLSFDQVVKIDPRSAVVLVIILVAATALVAVTARALSGR